MPGRSRKVTDENTKHGTRTAEGQKRRTTRRATTAAEAGLVADAATATRREVDAALKEARLEFLRSERKVWDDVADDFLHICDVEASISQLSVSPFLVVTWQVPAAYAHDLIDLMQFGGGAVFARLYRLRPMEMNDVAAQALSTLDQLAVALGVPPAYDDDWGSEG